MFRPLCLAILFLFVAGCVAEADPAAPKSETQPPAPEPTVDDVTGSITGTIVDEEQKPLPRAEIAVANQATTSDAAGSFTVNGIEPGQHTLFATLLGYEPAGKKVEVLAGEVTDVQLVLVPILIPDVYHESFSKTGMVSGQWTINHVQNMANNSALDSAMCGPCTWLVEFKPGIVDAVSDVTFKRSLSVPGVNEFIIMVYNKALNSGDLYSGLMTKKFGPDGETHHWTEAQVKQLKGVPKARLELRGPDPNNPGIAFQQKVELWQTFAWGAPLPEGFTLLPPS